MTTSLLRDAFAHHIWATERVIDECAKLRPQQQTSPAPGTYGSIIETLRHLVSSDCWYLSFFHDGTRLIDEKTDTSLDDLRSLIGGNGSAWMEVLARAIDPDEEIVELDDGWEVHSPKGVRLAQVVHDGTDHRSQVCMALTLLGIEPPDIDVWAYAREAERERAVRMTAP